MMIPDRIHLTLATVVGFSAMAIIGWNFGAPSTPTGASATGPANRPPRPARLGRSTPGPTGEAARKLAAIRASRDPAERMRITVELASMLSPSEFSIWMERGWFNIRGGAELTLFTKIVQERWSQEDPEGHLKWIWENQPDAASDIIASWAKRDPHKVLDFFKKQPDTRREIEALTTIAKNDPALALRRLQEMVAEGIPKNAEGYAGFLLRQLAAQSPAALETSLDALPASLRTQAEIGLIGLRMESSFAEEFHKLKDRPDGIDLLLGIFFRNGGNDAMKGQIFDELSDLPASWRSVIASRSEYFFSEATSATWVAADWEGFGFSKDQADQIRMNALYKMTFQQPEETLRLLDEMAWEGDFHRRMLLNIFQQLRNDPGKESALLARLGSDEDRQAVQEMIAARQSPSNEIPRVENPADWLAQVTARISEQGSPDNYLDMLGSWDSEKLAALEEQFKSMPDPSKRSLAVMIASNRLSSQNGSLEGEAIRYLVGNPAALSEVRSSDPFAEPNQTQDAIGLASAYIEKSAQDDPAAAGEWIRSLPAGDAKLWATKNLHSIWFQYDPTAADQWMESLPAATRDQVKSLGKEGGN